ncbi:MAG: hypothetical protein ACLFVJ_08860 [Persicimonas sp.]
MTDPISGTAASQMAEQAKQVGGEGAASGGSDSASKASFDDVLSEVQGREVEQTQGVDKTQDVGQAQEVEGIEGVDKAQQADGPAADRLRGFLDGMSTDEAELDQMMDKSINGGDMSQKDLLQMQALMYGYSQKVELTTKAVSNAASGMKQIMNTQV